MKNVACLTGRKLVDHIDGASIVVGIVTILKQYEDSILLLFIDYLAQFIVSNSEQALRYEFGYFPIILLFVRSLINGEIEFLAPRRN